MKTDIDCFIFVGALPIFLSGDKISRKVIMVGYIVDQVS